MEYPGYQGHFKCSFWFPSNLHSELLFHSPEFKQLTLKDPLAKEKKFLVLRVSFSNFIESRHKTDSSNF